MFSLRRKKEDEQRFPFSDTITESDARIVVDEEGTIVFASAAFMDLAHLNRKTIATHKFQTILSFDTPIEKPTELSSGTHTITLGNSNLVQEFHFDWVDMPAMNGNKRFHVGSYADENLCAAPSEPLTFEEPEQKAHSTHQDIEIFLGLSREMMIVTDESGKILRANSRFANVIEYSATELDNLTFIDLFDPEDSETIKTQNDCEARIISQTGQTLWIEWHKQARGDLTY